MRALQLSLLVIAISQSGCVGLASRWSAYLECKAAKRSAKLEARQLKLDAIKEENEMELEAIRAEYEAELSALKAQRSHELACLRASTEKENCVLKSQYDESIRTQLGLDLDQRLSVGQVQVNVDELKSLMAERDRVHNEQMEVYNALRDTQRKAQAEQWRPQVQTGPSCACAQPQCVPFATPTCDAPHACGCCQKCGLPMKPQVSTDCAGMRPFKEPMKPMQQPLSPTEIPLMVPVRLELGVTNSYVNDSRVRRLPQMLPQKEGCCDTEQCIPPAPVPAAPPSSMTRSSKPKAKETQPAVYEKEEE